MLTLFGDKPHDSELGGSVETMVLWIIELTLYTNSVDLYSGKILIETVRIMKLHNHEKVVLIVVVAVCVS